MCCSVSLHQSTASIHGLKVHGNSHNFKICSLLMPLWWYEKDPWREYSRSLRHTPKSVFLWLWEYGIVSQMIKSISRTTEGFHLQVPCLCGWQILPGWVEVADEEVTVSDLSLHIYSISKRVHKDGRAHWYRGGNNRAHYAFRLTPKSSIPEAGWNSGECTGSLFMAKAASIHSE